MKYIISVGAIVILCVGAVLLLLKPTRTQPSAPLQRPSEPSQSVQQQKTSDETRPPAETAQPIETDPYQRIDVSEIPDADEVYDFSVDIPVHWQLEAIPGVEALNFYDPSAQGENGLEQSQIFVRYFRANRFLTLSTVTIHERGETEINGRSVVIYDIEKKTTVPPFPSQPVWRNKRHSVTDIRLSKNNPSIFVVIAKRPDLPQEIFDRFVNSLSLPSDVQALAEPTRDFKKRITKKPFGILITPEKSPVQPERFRGYHTAADVEYDDVADDVPVYAIGDGTVVRSNIADGYGGILAIRHTVSGVSYLGIYGHIDPSSLVSNGAAVTKGQQIGILADGYSPESGGERKHLHFGIYRGSDIAIRGYVPSREELSSWINPLTLYGKQ